jgi:beta-glucanase (GH16 family)
MKKYRFILLAILGGIVAICSCDRSPNEIVDNYIYVQKEARRNDSTQWKLVWEDQFDKGSLDTTRWNRIGLFTSPQWKIPVEKWRSVKNWSRYITATDDRVVSFDTNNIMLKGIINPDSLTGDPRPYLTGGIYSWNKFAFQYGRIEIKAKLDPAYGAWPAIWMLPEKRIYPNQSNGEMDIMERLNHDDFAYQTTHNHYADRMKQNEPKKNAKAQINPDDYNIYSVSWYPDKLVYAVNGVVSYTYPKVPGAGTFQWPFDQPFFLMIDQQMEHTWPGPITNSKELPISMTVDWVHLYK